MKDHDPEKTIVNPDQFLRHRPKSELCKVHYSSAPFFQWEMAWMSLPVTNMLVKLNHFPQRILLFFLTQKHI